MGLENNGALTPSMNPLFSIPSRESHGSLGKRRMDCITSLFPLRSTRCFLARGMNLMVYWARKIVCFKSLTFLIKLLPRSGYEPHGWRGQVRSGSNRLEQIDFAISCFFVISLWFCPRFEIASVLFPSPFAHPR